MRGGASANLLARLPASSPNLSRASSSRSGIISNQQILRFRGQFRFSSFQSRTHRMASDRDVLPDTVKPLSYHLSVFDVKFLEQWTFQGRVKIALDIHKTANEIQLNTKALKIHSALLSTEHTKTETSTAASSIEYDEKRERATLSFDQEFLASQKAWLDIEYEGIINNNMAGFYRSRYKPAIEAAKSVPRDNEYHYMFSTQFESCDARQAFPCFDEPNLKATFDLEIEIPEDQVALSNMPEKATKSSKDGWKVVSFDTTPVMSTYLLTWAFGDFEYVEAFTERKYNGKNLPVRVYTTRGLKEQGQWALDHAHKTVDYFSEIFKIDYPLPKSDLLAVHEFSHGAMEGWGLVTYRTTAVLYDEKNSDQKYKNRVAYVVAHELAHQWFGNLVTMDWWNELWLNEGFATWVGWLAVDRFHPDWNVWSQFVAEAVQTAMNLDAIRNSHPIEVPVKDALEVDQVFDHISYLKGSSVIRMLSSHLGQETFLQGVSDYLKKHSYANARTSDLWAALSAASGHDVNAFMDSWIQKIGFPVLTVTEEPGQLGVKQSRFLVTGDVKPDEDETTWWIPLGLKYAVASKGVSARALTEKEMTIRDIDEQFYKLNAEQTGFYRTNYPSAHLTKLGEHRDQLSTEDRIGLLGDAAALAQSGDATTAAFLALAELFSDEKSYLVWQQITTSLGNIRSIFGDVTDISLGLKAYTLKLVTPAVRLIGWDFAANEDFLTGQLRALLIAQAGLAGHQPTVDEATRRFTSFTAGDSSAIHPSLRSAVFRIAVTYGGKSAYDAVKNYYLTTTSVDGRELALQAMGRVQSDALAKEYLDFIFSPAVAVQDRHSPAISLAANVKTRLLLWDFIKENWDAKVFPELSGNFVVLERFLRTGLNKFADLGVKEDIEKFFRGKDQRGYDRGLGVVMDTIEGSAKYKLRDEGVVREWLGTHGYVQGE